MRSALLVLLAATGLWGLSSAALAGIGGAVTSASLVSAGGGAALLIFAAARGDRPWRTFAAAPGLYLRLGVLEAVNLLCYVAALRLGPLPLVVSLHLTAPVLLILAAVVRGRRPLRGLVVGETVLVGVAVWLAGAWRPESAPVGRTLLGCALALASAGCVALLITLVARESEARASVASAGWQLLVAAVLGSVLMAAGPPDPASAGWLLLIGVLLLGPGFALYWYALRRVDATAAGILGLNEAVVASVANAIHVGAAPSGGVLVAGVLVLAAVALEQWSAR